MGHENEKFRAIKKALLRKGRPFKPNTKIMAPKYSLQKACQLYRNEIVNISL